MSVHAKVGGSARHYFGAMLHMYTAVENTLLDRFFDGSLRLPTPGLHRSTVPSSHRLSQALARAIPAEGGA